MSARSFQVVERLVEAHVAFLWQTLALAAVLAVLLRCISQKQARLRYAFATGALFLAAVLPLVEPRSLHHSDAPQP